MFKYRVHLDFWLIGEQGYETADDALAAAQRNIFLIQALPASIDWQLFDNPVIEWHPPEKNVFETDIGRVLVMPGGLLHFDTTPYSGTFYKFAPDGIWAEAEDNKLTIYDGDNQQLESFLFDTVEITKQVVDIID